MRFAGAACAQRRVASSRAACATMAVSSRWLRSPSGRTAQARPFRKTFALAGGQRRSGQRIVSMREYSRQTVERKAGHLAVSRREKLPLFWPLRLSCAAFTCLLLLISSLSTPPAMAAPSKLLCCGTQKMAGHASFSIHPHGNDRIAACKFTSSNRVGMDIRCVVLLARLSVRDRLEPLTTVLPQQAGNARAGTCGARAPPFPFA